MRSYFEYSPFLHTRNITKVMVSVLQCARMKLLLSFCTIKSFKSLIIARCIQAVILTSTLFTVLENCWLLFLTLAFPKRA